MKRGITYFLPFIMMVVVMSASCGRGASGVKESAASDTTGKAVIEFKTMEHNFGTITPGEKVGCIFSFRNAGDADLIVTSAVASCGCTVPKFDKKPIAPGGNGVIEVVFDSSGRSGIQAKTIVVQSNAENNLIILRIIAEIKSE